MFYSAIVGKQAGSNTINFLQPESHKRLFWESSLFLGQNQILDRLVSIAFLYNQRLGKR